MNFGAKNAKFAKQPILQNLWQRSATRNADPFGFVGFDDVVREDWISTSSFKSHRAIELAERLKEYHPQHVSGAGVSDVWRFLPRERSLVFMISDFHMPLSQLEGIACLT